MPLFQKDKGEPVFTLHVVGRIILFYCLVLFASYWYVRPYLLGNSPIDLESINIGFILLYFFCWLPLFVLQKYLLHLLWKGVRAFTCFSLAYVLLWVALGCLCLVL